jgi:hypothetical protein
VGFPTLTAVQQFHILQVENIPVDYTGQFPPSGLGRAGGLEIMMTRLVAIVLMVLGWLPLAGMASAATATATAASVQKAKQAAEAKGYAFISSRDEILSAAKKEGKVRVQSSLDPNTFKPLAESFKKKYPFADIEILELTGTDAAQRYPSGTQSGSGQRLGRIASAGRFLYRLRAICEKTRPVRDGGAESLEYQSKNGRSRIPHRGEHRFRHLRHRVQ